MIYYYLEPYTTADSLIIVFPISCKAKDIYTKIKFSFMLRKLSALIGYY